MKNVVDSSIWLEWLTNRLPLPEYDQLITDTPSLIVPTIVVYEVHRVIASRISVQAADDLVYFMQQGTLVALDASLALKASDIARTNKLAVADAIIYATALSAGATLWTQDAHFEGLPGVKYFPKPSTT